MKERIVYPGQHGWRCPNCGKLEKALNPGPSDYHLTLGPTPGSPLSLEHLGRDDRMIQKVYDHVCSKPKWWRFWETRIDIKAVWR